MTIVTITRDQSVSQKTFTYAHEARNWLLLQGYTWEDPDRYTFSHPYTHATAIIKVNKWQSTQE
jgi:hypothetical protein